jgi:hypothetical protein
MASHGAGKLRFEGISAKWRPFQIALGTVRETGDPSPISQAAICVK